MSGNARLWVVKGDVAALQMPFTRVKVWAEDDCLCVSVEEMGHTPNIIDIPAAIAGAFLAALVEQKSRP